MQDGCGLLFDLGGCGRRTQTLQGLSPKLTPEGNCVSDLTPQKQPGSQKYLQCISRLVLKTPGVDCVLFHNILVFPSRENTPIFSKTAVRCGARCHVYPRPTATVPVRPPGIPGEVGVRGGSAETERAGVVRAPPCRPARGRHLSRRCHGPAADGPV